LTNQPGLFFDVAGEQMVYCAPAYVFVHYRPPLWLLSVHRYFNFGKRYTNIILSITDFRCADGKSWRVKGQHLGYSIGFGSVFQKNQSSPPKSEPLNQEMPLRMLPLSVDLKLSNPKLGHREPALHLFVKQIPSI
jgi:hypothetical protein